MSLRRSDGRAPQTLRHRLAPAAIALLVACPTLLAAQTPARRDSASTTLAPVRIQVTAVAPVDRLPEVTASAIHTARRAELIRVGRTDANLSLNSVRQVFARTPGLMVWEQDGAGIQAGVAARGLSPNRSWEFNVRANGVDIAADAFGYPEAYYTPPFRSLERIEVIRGATSLQYGSQYGGVLNYVTKRGPTDRALAVEASQQGGGAGFYSGYLGAGGTQGRATWYAYGDLRRGEGWRANSRFNAAAAGANMQVRTSARGTLDASLAWQDYDLQQPGGLTEAQWRSDARQSFRTRDTFGAPWFVPSLTYEHLFGRTTLNVRAFGLMGAATALASSDHDGGGQRAQSAARGCGPVPQPRHRGAAAATAGRRADGGGHHGRGPCLARTHRSPARPRP